MRKLVALCVLLVVGTLALPSGELRFRQRRSQQEGALALQQKLAAVDDAEVFNLLRMAQQFTPVEDPADPISPQLEHRLAELQKEISDSLAAVKLAADQGVQDQGMASAGRELLELYYHLRAAVEHHVDKFNTRNEVRQLVADVEELDKKKAAGSLEMVRVWRCCVAIYAD